MNIPIITQIPVIRDMMSKDVQYRFSFRKSWEPVKIVKDHWTWYVSDRYEDNRVNGLEKMILYVWAYWPGVKKHAWSPIGFWADDCSLWINSNDAIYHKPPFLELPYMDANEYTRNGWTL